LKKKIHLNALVSSLFWDWIKCHVSDGLPFRLSLEPAVRLIYQFTILIPSYNAHEMVPFWLVPRIKRTLLKQPIDQTDCQKKKHHQSYLQSCLRLWLATLRKNKHKSIVFKHIQWICVFPEKRHHYLSIVLCDLLIIYERIRHHLHLLRCRTLKQTQYFVFIHI